MKPTYKEDLKVEKKASLALITLRLSKCNLLFISTGKPGEHVIGRGITRAGLISLCGCGGVEVE